MLLQLYLLRWCSLLLSSGQLISLWLCCEVNSSKYLLEITRYCTIVKPQQIYILLLMSCVAPSLRVVVCVHVHCDWSASSSWDLESQCCCADVTGHAKLDEELLRCGLDLVLDQHISQACNRRTLSIQIVRRIAWHYREGLQHENHSFWIILLWVPESCISLQLCT